VLCLRLPSILDVPDVDGVGAAGGHRGDEERLPVHHLWPGISGLLHVLLWILPKGTRQPQVDQLDVFHLPTQGTYLFRINTIGNFLLIVQWAFDGFLFQIFHSQDFDSNYGPIPGDEILDSSFDLKDTPTWGLWAAVFGYVLLFRCGQYLLFAYQTGKLQLPFMGRNEN